MLVVIGSSLKVRPVALVPSEFYSKIDYCAFVFVLKIKVLYVLLIALPPVCMKYIAQDDSRVANIARGEAECYICHKTLINSCILSYK